MQVYAQKPAQEKLAAFSKLYGYVKYFHPSDEAAELDWDAFAIYGTEQILKAKNEDFEATLKKLFLPIAPSLVIYSEGTIQPLDSTVFLKKYRKNFRPINWQHLGNGNFSNSDTFKSLRTNRRRRFNPSVGEIAIKVCIEKTNLPKKYQLEFRLSNKLSDGYYRANISYCWRDSTLKKSCHEIGDIYHTSWNKYKVNFIVPEETTGSFIKIKLVGNGETLVDDINLTEFQSGKSISKIDFDAPTKSKNSLIYNLSKDFNSSLYKYELVKKENNSYLRIFAEKKFKKDSALFISSVKYGDVILKDIDKTLKVKLPLVLMGNQSHTFPVADKQLLMNLQDSLETIKKFLKRDALSTRLSDIIILWNEIQHFYPYLENLPVDWGSVLETAINNSLKSKNGSEHINEIKKMVAYLKDSHVQVRVSGGKTTYHMPLEIELIENKVIIKRLLGKFKSIEVGDEIVMLDGDSIKHLLNKTRLFISSGNEKIISERALNEIFQFNKNEFVFLKVRNIASEVNDVLMKASLTDFRHGVLIEEQKETSITKKINSEIFYLNFSEISFLKFEQVTSQLKEASSIIVDLRGYPKESGDNFRKIIAHFLEKDDTTKWMFTPYIEKPDRENMFDRSRAVGWIMKKTDPNFSNTKIYFLVNHKAQSYAESIIGYFDNMSNVTLLGSPTAGANGNVVYSSLPSGIYYRYTGMKVLKHDGSRLHGIGFLPDVEVRPTIKGIIEGRDEVLEKAIELASENKD